MMAGAFELQGPSPATRCVILPAPHPFLSRRSLSLHAPDKGFHSAQKEAKELPTMSQAKKENKTRHHVCVKVNFDLIEGDQHCVLLRGRSAKETQGLLLFSFRMYLGESSE